MTEPRDRVSLFVEALRDDPRVVGIARLADEIPDVPRLFVVTTWDGLEPLTASLPTLAAPLLAAGPRIERVEEARWTGVDVEGSRAEVELRRVGDLVPECKGEAASPLHDPRGLVEQWIRYSGKPRDTAVAAQLAAPPVDLLLGLDASLRLRSARGRGPSAENAWWLRAVRPTLRADDPAEAALARRIDDALAAEPGPVGGDRVLAGDDAAATYESFLATADREGFKGDRVLFGEAAARLRGLSKRGPVFEQGFVLPTFDAVEAAFALGEAVGGCKPPLVPGVYVGVGVTPNDALEFWAAPFVRDPTCSVGCVDDLGERDVVERTAGREPMVSALLAAVDAAFERLPAHIEAARRAQKDSVDPAPVLAALHLPRSFVERAKRRGADALLCSRLSVALAVARAGDDAAPLVARKLGLAAGRVLAARP